jgi:hypothetical protein
MGALKLRVGGSWVTIPGYGNTIGVPAGGVAGDLLVKNSATAGDALWGTTIPKLKLTPGNVVGLDLLNPALQIGESTGQNLVAYWSGLMSRDNGAAAIMRLNYYGGEVIVNGGGAASTKLTVAEPTGTGKRAMVDIGTWEFGQDQSNNGTKDFYLYAGAFGTAFNINAAGNLMALGTGVTNYKLQVGSAGAATLQVGDDAYFQDANLTNGLVLKGVANGGLGVLAFGSTSNRIGYDGELRLIASATMTVQADTLNVLNTVSNTWRMRHNGAFEVWGSTTIHGNLSSDNGVYCGSGEYFRVVGAGGIFFNDTNTGWIGGPIASWMQTYGGSWVCFNGGLAMANGSNQGCPIRLYSRDDNSHILQFSRAVPAGSGEACDGPMLRGYGTVYLTTMLGGQFFLASGGSVFINAGKSYLTFSSREHKDNIVMLDPDESLDMVRRWQPVEFDLKADGTHAEGFIAEDHVAVTPAMVHVCGPDSERPGWANAVDPGLGVVRLAGAVQALLRRVEQLEGKAA